MENLQTLKSDMAELVHVEAGSGHLNKRSRHYRATGLMRYITVIFMTICLPTVCAAGAQPERTHRVLVLNSYHRGYYRSDDIMEAIQAEFNKTGLGVELHFEYMDTQRHRLRRAAPYLKQLYQTKYQNVQFDLIISSDDNALYFLLDHRDLLFPGVPIVFCGVQQIDEDDARRLSPITGVFEQYDYESTMAIALKLHPLAGRIVVIHERTADSSVFQRNIASVVPRLDRAVELVSFSLAELTMAGLLQKLDKLGDESVVLLESALKDREESVYTLDDSLTMIDKHCAAPIYITGFDMLGLGPVGGRLTHGYHQGQAAAKMAIRILNGESARNIPILRESPNAYMFDYIQLKHFGISLSQLPEGSIVINEPQSFYYWHKGQIWPVIAIIAGLTAAVMILSANILRRRRAEETLIESEEKYKKLFKETTDAIFVADAETGILTDCNRVAAELVGRVKSELVGKHQRILHPPQEIEGKFSMTFKQHLGEKEGQVLEAKVITKKGEIKDVAIRASRLELRGRKLIQAVFRDITERKRAEEALRESEEKYRSVVENIGIGVSLINPKMEILAVNRQMRQWFPDVNVSTRPICHKVFNNPPRDDICSYCPVCKSLKDGQVHESITETPAGDKIVNYRIVSSPIKDTDGKVIAAIEMVEEITERKKAEEALRESERRFKALFQGAAEGILVADIETKEFKYANPAVCRMLGYTEVELKRRGVRDIHPKEDLEYVVSEFESQARGEKTLSLGIPCLRKDGTTMYADIDTAKVLIDGRECNVGFFTDITKRKKAEEELYEAEAKYRTLVEQIPAVTYIAALDKASTTLYISPQIETLIGFSREEYEKDPDIWRKRLHPDDRGRVMAEVERSHKSSEPFCCEYRMLARDDRVVWFRDEAVIVRSSKNQPLFLQGVMFDITELKLSEEALQNARDELEIRVKRRTADLAKVNKELRNEINERKKAEKKLRSLAEKLSLAEEHLRRRIATDIHDHIGQNLAISKIKLESLAESMSTSKLAKSLGEIRKVIAEIIESTRSLTFELSPPVLYELGFEAAVEWLVRQAREQHGLSTEFKGDGKAKALDDDVCVLLFQAVRELLVNVAKHAQARNVMVSTRRVGDEIRVKVEDDGVGFDMSRVSSRDYKTGGFGLFSIRERLSHIGGHLDVESKPGHGTRVTLVAPINHKGGSAKEQTK